MVSIINAILLGIIQGITEWLPVSSSGHLAIAEHFLGITEPLLLNISLHIGTLLVVLLVFHKDVLQIIRSFARLDFRSEHGRLGILILVGSVPTAIIGYSFHDLFASFFTSMTAVGAALIATSALLFFSKRFAGKRRVDVWDSIIVGAAQGLAIIPGISRSGATISAAMISGVERAKAARYSFLLMMPAVLGAAAYEFDAAALGADLGPVLAGTAASIIAGYISLRYLLRLIMKGKFHLFAYYCFAAGILLLAFAV